MAYEITKLIKKGLKREAEFHRKPAEFRGQMERDLTNSENPLPNKVDCLSCISECYSEELWNLDGILGIGPRQCQ